MRCKGISKTPESMTPRCCHALRAVLTETNLRSMSIGACGAARCLLSRVSLTRLSSLSTAHITSSSPSNRFPRISTLSPLWCCVRSRDSLRMCTVQCSLAPCILRGVSTVYLRCRWWWDHTLKLRDCINQYDISPLAQIPLKPAS